MRQGHHSPQEASDPKQSRLVAYLLVVPVGDFKAEGFQPSLPFVGGLMIGELCALPFGTAVGQIIVAGVSVEARLNAKVGECGLILLSHFLVVNVHCLGIDEAVGDYLFMLGGKGLCRHAKDAGKHQQCQC